MQLSHSYASDPDGEVLLLWEVQITSLKAETIQRDLARVLCARFSLLQGMPLATQNLQTSLSHLQGDLRVQK